MPSDPDRQIIQEIRSGQPRRYAVLVDRHRDRALTLAVRMVGNREEAEELVQDGFVRAFRSLDDFRGEAKFGTWFYRIVYNLCLTSTMRKKEVPGAGLEMEIPAAEGDPHSRLEAEDLQALLARAIKRLPEQQRVAITLFYVQDLTYDEIAAVTGLPMGTVKTHLFRGRENLRRLAGRRIEEEVS